MYYRKFNIYLLIYVISVCCDILYIYMITKVNESFNVFDKFCL